MAALFAGAIVLERLMLTPLYSDATERKDEYGSSSPSASRTSCATPRSSRSARFVEAALVHPGHSAHRERHRDQRSLVAGGVGSFSSVAALLHETDDLGQALDAVSQSRDAAAIVGINAQRFNSIAFGIGAALAAAAGALVAPIFSLAPDMGVLRHHAYVIVILGGMGSVGGSIIAGLVLGEAENLFTAFFPDPTRAFAYTNAFGVLVLMVVLIVRPQGLFAVAI